MVHIPPNDIYENKSKKFHRDDFEIKNLTEASCNCNSEYPKLSTHVYLARRSLLRLDSFSNEDFTDFDI